MKNPNTNNLQFSWYLYIYNIFLFCSLRIRRHIIRPSRHSTEPTNFQLKYFRSDPLQLEYREMHILPMLLHPWEKEKLLAKVKAAGTEAPGWRGRVRGYLPNSEALFAASAATVPLHGLQPSWYSDSILHASCRARFPSLEKHCKAVAGEAGDRDSFCPVAGRLGSSPCFPSGSGLVFMTSGKVWSPSYAHGLCTDLNCRADALLASVMLWMFSPHS